MHYPSRLIMTVTAMALLIMGCATTPDLPRKALIEKQDIEAAVTLEGDIAARAESEAPQDAPWFAVLRGTIPVIVTAPHATTVMRNGKRRFSDGAGTAALAALLHEKTGATAIFTTYAAPSDPNYYDDNAFKETLRTLITETNPAVVLDLHGSHAYRPYDVDFGTMNGESLRGNEQLLRQLIACLREEGVNNFSSNFFSAAGQDTITKWASELGAPAIQLEVSATSLMPSEGPIYAHRFAQVAQALTRFVEKVGGHHESTQ